MNVQLDHWIKDEDRLRFHSDGYMVIRNVIQPDAVGNAVREITRFLGADLGNSATWYRNAPENDGIVPMHHLSFLPTSPSTVAHDQPR